MEEVHERTCQNDDSNEGGGDPKGTVQIRFIFEYLAELWFEKDRAFDSRKDVLFFNIEILSLLRRNVLSMKAEEEIERFSFGRTILLLLVFIAFG